MRPVIPVIPVAPAAPVAPVMPVTPVTPVGAVPVVCVSVIVGVTVADDLNPLPYNAGVTELTR